MAKVTHEVTFLVLAALAALPSPASAACDQELCVEITKVGQTVYVPPQVVNFIVSLPEKPPPGQKRLVTVFLYPEGREHRPPLKKKVCYVRKVSSLCFLPLEDLAGIDQGLGAVVLVARLSNGEVDGTQRKKFNIKRKQE